MSPSAHKSSLCRSEPNTPCTAGTSEFSINPAMASSLGLGKDPANDFPSPDQLLIGNSSMDQVAQLVHTAPLGFQVQPPLQLSLSQLLSLGPSVLGWQVLVQGAEGSFIGYLCWLLDHCSRLGLEQASRPESGVRRVGVLLLTYCHVSSVTLLARRASQPRPRPAAAKSGVAEEKRGRSLLMKKLISPCLAKKPRDDDDDGEDQSGDEEEVPPLPPPVLRLRRPSSWIVIDALNESYQAAVSAISEEPLVGLSAVGHKLGRWGTLAWLAVATPHTVYLFDAATLGLQSLLLGTSANGKTPRGLQHRHKNPHDDGKDPSVQCNSHPGPTCVSNSSPLRELPRSKDSVSSQKCLDISGSSEREIAAADSNGPHTADAGSHSAEHDSSAVLSLPGTDEDSLELPRGGLMCDRTVAHQDVGDQLRHKCLKEVLEDPHLEVVVHDSRNLQDFLQHRAGFTINALFDTQATEVYLYITLHGGDCPAFVPSLSSVLQRRLHLAPQHLLYERVQRRLAGDSSAYLERPLDEGTLQGIASSAAFLCELRALQLRDVLADLRQLTALHCFSHALKDDLMRSRVEQHVVPAAVQRLGRQTVLNYRDSSYRRRI